MEFLSSYAKKPEDLLFGRWTPTTAIPCGSIIEADPPG
ncbi:MAG: hypothetical protein QOD99_796 [Chthoniobacter sp.]|jgi:hypothetical protein|nr:hypothetical protein [Chthoniobacter sp.]